MPDAFLALDYMLDRFTWIVEGLVVYPERMERNLWASHGLFFSHRLLLALVEAGVERADAYRLVQRNAMRAWDEERDFGELVRADPEITARLDAQTLDERLRPRRDRSPTSTAPSTDFAASSPRRNPFMSETATHVASGKVREIYALDDERLLLVASDRISTFDVVLPTEIPDKGRVLTGLSAFWFARTAEIVPNHLLALREDGRSTECRAPRDAADRVRRPRLPLRLRLEGLPRDRRGLRPPAARGTRRVAAAAAADLHARRRRRRSGTTRTSTARRPSS